MFAPRPPRKNNNSGEWKSPGGIDLGISDPRRSTALALGTTARTGSSAPQAVNVLVQPGVDVAPLLRAQCTQDASDKAQQSFGVDYNGPGIRTGLHIVWLGKEPRGLARDASARLDVALLYDAGPGVPRSPTTFHVNGAGRHFTTTVAKRYTTLRIRPTRQGRITITARAGHVAAANRLQLTVK